jgi:hypothetical protein
MRYLYSVYDTPDSCCCELFSNHLYLSRRGRRCRIASIHTPDSCCCELFSNRLYSNRRGRRCRIASIHSAVSVVWNVTYCWTNQPAYTDVSVMRTVARRRAGHRGLTNTRKRAAYALYDRPIRAVSCRAIRQGLAFRRYWYTRYDPSCYCCRTRL